MKITGFESNAVSSVVHLVAHVNGGVSAKGPLLLLLHACAHRMPDVSTDVARLFASA